MNLDGLDRYLENNSNRDGRQNVGYTASTDYWILVALRDIANSLREHNNNQYPETHRQGFVQLHNLEEIQQMNLMKADFGVQIANDGRVWVCVNGLALIRFKPSVNP